MVCSCKQISKHASEWTMSGTWYVAIIGLGWSISSPAISLWIKDDETYIIRITWVPSNLKIDESIWINMNQYEQLDQIQYMEHKWSFYLHKPYVRPSGFGCCKYLSDYPSFGITLPSRRSHASVSFCLYSCGFLTWHTSMTELSNTALGRLQPPRSRIALQAAEEYASCFRRVLVDESTQNPEIQPHSEKCLGLKIEVS